jgi:hypothetical protein
MISYSCTFHNEVTLITDCCYILVRDLCGLPIARICASIVRLRVPIMIMRRHFLQTFSS